MIITRLHGGLGNQMFQYAAGLALAERRRTVLKLDVSWFKESPEFEAHNRYALSCFNITEQFATEEEVDRIRGLRLTRTERWLRGGARMLRLRQLERQLSSAGHTYHAATEGSYEPGFAACPDNTYVAGLWQSEKYFTHVANLLRLHFTFRYPAQPSVTSMLNRIQSGRSVAIHFRRGDYARNPQYARDIGVVDLGFYLRALEKLTATVPDLTAYVFSDDVDAVEREFRPPIPHVFVRATEHWHSYDKIRLMSACEHAIISNSTFAWWAAWLNPNPRKLVIAPDPWLAGKPANSVDTIPDGWLRLPRGG